MRFIFRGRRSFWWSWTMTLVTPRIVNSVSCVKRIDHESHFAWQAQYLVKFECHFSWQAQYSVKFGMIAGARNVVFFNTKCSWWAWKVTSVARRVADWRFHARIILGSAAHWKWRFIRFQQISLRFWTVIFRGRRSIWWVWTMTHVAPRIVNSDSCVTRINHEIHFSWQAQYLVSLDNDTCCSAHCK